MYSTQIVGLLLALGGAVENETQPRNTAFEILRQKIAEQRRSVSPDIEAAVQAHMQRIQDCTNEPPPQNYSASQYIYNADYSWGYSESNGATCIYLMQPELKALTKEEAFDLILAGRIPFPPPPGYAPSEPTDSSAIVPHIVGDNMPFITIDDDVNQREGAYIQSPSLAPRQDPSRNPKKKN